MLAVARYNLGGTYGDLYQHEKGLGELKLALEYFNETQNFRMIAMTLRSISTINTNQVKLEQAEEYVRESIAVATKSSNHYEHMMSLDYLIQLNITGGDFDNCRKYCEELKKLAKGELFADSIMLYNAALADIYLMTGDFEKAFEYYQKLGYFEYQCSEMDTRELKKSLRYYLLRDDIDNASIILKEALERNELKLQLSDYFYFMRSKCHIDFERGNQKDAIVQLKAIIIEAFDVSAAYEVIWLLELFARYKTK